MVSQISPCGNAQNIVAQSGFGLMLCNVKFNAVQPCGRQITSISYGELIGNIINGVNRTRLMGAAWTCVSGLRFPLTSCYRIFGNARGMGNTPSALTDVVTQVEWISFMCHFSVLRCTGYFFSCLNYDCRPGALLSSYWTF